MDIFQIQDLSFRYPNAKQPAIAGLTLSVAPGEFVLVAGASGSGKTTLLRLLKPALAPAGEKIGQICYKGEEMEGLDEVTAASKIGFVLQDPESQIVTDRVWSELAFGAENVGIPPSRIGRRIGETATYFGIDNWLYQPTHQLSGGQKQLLNLASVTLTDPDVLILDEPTAQLDPIAAAEFLTTLRRLNRELGVTVILSEHRLEEVFPMADRVILLEEGRLLVDAPPADFGRCLRAQRIDHPMLAGLPSAQRIATALGETERCPLTVREGRAYLQARYTGKNQPPIPVEPTADEVALELRDCWFRYEKNSSDILRGTGLQLRRGEIFALLGGNGAGKTTALGVLAGLLRPYRGRVLVEGKPLEKYGDSLYRRRLAMLPQNPRTLFLHPTLAEDLALRAAPAAVQAMADRLSIAHLLDRHPYDLSGGEIQKAALALLLLAEPTILLLDEPTKGLDPAAKAELAGLLGTLAGEGMAILAVTHDVEFAAESADRCALFFDGQVGEADCPARFFADHHFYTTAASRMARGLWPTAVTCDAVIAAARAEEEARL